VGVEKWVEEKEDGVDRDDGELSNFFLRRWDLAKGRWNFDPECLRNIRKDGANSAAAASDAF